MSKKALIIEAAIELFAKKGYESTSIQEITELCGISKGAFYLSFKSKEELFLSIIDHVVVEVGNAIDQVVKSDIDAEQKLYFYFSHLFQFLLSQRSLAKIFSSERPRQVEDQLLHKLHYYDKQFSQSFLKLFEAQYGDAIAETKYDLVLCVKGLLTSYSEYVLFQQHDINIPNLTQSLVDKINVLAQYSTKAFVTKEMFERRGICHSVPIPMEEIQQKIQKAISQAEDKLEKESLIILQQQLQSSIPSNATIIGMLNNLRDFPSARDVIIALQNYQTRVTG